MDVTDAAKPTISTMRPVPIQQGSDPDLPTSSSSAAVFPTLDVLNCKASELAQYLLQHRFQKDPDQATKFLQAALTKAKSHDAPQAPDPEDLDMGDILTTSPSEISLVTPRAGKFQLTVHQKGLVAVKSNNEAIQMVIPQGCVTHILLFPKPEDFKATTGGNSKKPPTSDLVLMCLEPPTIFQNKPVSQICIQLPWEKTQGALGPALSNNNETPEDATDLWLQLLTQSLGSQAVVSRVVRQKGGNSFSSFQLSGTSTTTAGMPFVKCYHGVQDGVLYPLEEGLLFFKPPRFIPRSQLHTIACGRGSSSTNSSRYVDMILQLLDDSTIEFSNIQREELAVLNEYIHKVLIPAMQQDASSGSKNKADGSGKSDKQDPDAAVQAEGDEEADHDSESSDEDDEDFNMHSDHHDSENESDSEEEDGDSDDGGGVEVVEDDFVKELAKKKNADSATESEEEEDTPRSKRRRRG